MLSTYANFTHASESFFRLKRAKQCSSTLDLNQESEYQVTIGHQEFPATAQFVVVQGKNFAITKHEDPSKAVSIGYSWDINDISIWKTEQRSVNPVLIWRYDEPSQQFKRVDFELPPSSGRIEITQSRTDDQAIFLSYSYYRNASSEAFELVPVRKPLFFLFGATHNFDRIVEIPQP